jgi:hypothetical protein
VTNPFATPAQRSAAPIVHLAASTLEAQTIHRYSNGTVLNAVPTQLGHTTSTSARYTHANATMLAPGGRYSYYLTAVDDKTPPAIDVAGSFLDVMPAGDAPSRVDYVGQTPSDPVVPGGLLGAASDRTVTVRVTGDFALSFYDWQMEVSDASSHDDLWAGTRWRSTAGPNEVQVVGDSEVRQVFLVARDAQLVLELNATTDMTLLLLGQSYTASGVLACNGPQGTLQTDDGPVAPKPGAPVEVSGAFAGQLGLASDRVELDVHGDGATARQGDLTLALKTTTPAPAASWTSWLLMLGLALPVLGVGVRRTAQSWRMRAMRFAGESRDDRSVLRHGDRLLQVRRFRRDAAILQTVALVRLDRLDEAAAVLAMDDAWAGSPAIRDYLSAVLHAKRGELGRAATLLQSCLAMAPEMLAEARANPALAALAPSGVRPGSVRGDGYA